MDHLPGVRPKGLAEFPCEPRLARACIADDGNGNGGTGKNVLRKCRQLRPLAVASYIRAQAARDRSTEARDVLADADQREDVLLYPKTTERTRAERYELGVFAGSALFARAIRG